MRARSVWDPLTTFGGTFLNAIAPFTPPMLSVKEAFGEIEIPVVRNRPFMDELTLSGAVRVSDYNTSAGTVWIGSSLTSEVRYVSADSPYEPFQIVLPRVQEVEYDLTHHGDSYPAARGGRGGRGGGPR